MSKKLIIAGVLAAIACYAGLRQPDDRPARSVAEVPAGAAKSAPAATGPVGERESSFDSGHAAGSVSRANRTEGTTASGGAIGNAATIDRLTAESRVAGYLQQHQQLPDYYIRKSAARKQGWDPAKGNLCQVLPGRAIGGDRFSNREGGLPEQKGRNWYEADVNYQCGRRGADRLLYSSDGLIFVTRDHYRHFEQVK